MKLRRADGHIIETDNEDVIKTLLKRGATSLDEDKPVKAVKEVKSKELVHTEEEPIETASTIAEKKDISKMNVTELRAYASDLGIVGAKNMSKATLIAIINEH